MRTFKDKIAVLKILNEKDLFTALKIRYEVFVIEQKVPLNEEQDEFDKTACHYLAIYNHTPVGTARWRKTHDGYKLERFAVLPQNRGRGIAAELVKRILSEVPKDLQVYLHAQIEAVHLYEKFNFKIIGDKFIESGISHYKMVLLCD